MPSTSQLKEKNVEVSKSVTRKSFKANSSRDITIVNMSYVCECGFSSSSKSGTTRHKCHKDKLLLKCSYCEKHCGNSGSLKLHMKSKHREEMKNSTANIQEVLENMVALDQEEETVKVNDEQECNSGFKCPHCTKVCSNSGSLKVHMKFKHKNVLEKSLESEVTKEVDGSETTERSVERSGLEKSQSLEKSALD